MFSVSSYYYYYVYNRFKQIMDIKAVHPFRNAEEALAACTAIAAGDATESLITFLDQNLPKKRKKCQLGVADPNLAKSLAQQKFPVIYDKSVLEIMRVVRLHLQR
jgi:nucleolar protein 56